MQAKIIFVSGWAVDKQVWENLICHLPSNILQQSYDLIEFRQNQQQIIEQAQAPIVLCAWSFASLIALNLANQYPQKIKALCLFAPSPCFVNKKLWHNALSEPVADKFATSFNQQPNKALERFLALNLLGDAKATQIKAQIRNYLEKQAKNNTYVLDEILNQLLYSDVRDICRLINQPSLLIHGKNDAIAPVKASLWLHQTLRQSELIAIENTGHAPLISQSEICAQHIVNWLCKKVKV